MYEGPYRRAAATEYRRQRAPRIIERPDRIAFWAVAMALVAMVAAAASAQGSSGGTGSTGPCADVPFGDRTLSMGDCGDDVKTLHWLLKADSYGVPLDKEFDNPTDDSVRRFQRRHDLDSDGVVGRTTRRQIVRTMNKSVATWYGPGFYGNRTACGKRLRRDTIGVAHRRKPCGTKVTFAHNGHFVRARVIDRGPYAHGARWDLTERTAKKLHLSTTDTIRAAPIG
jgi:hypothetical protein